MRSDSTSEKPMIALSGVRSSCDMLARNSDLCWFATSSCALFSWISRNSRTFSIAITAWSAKVLSSSICLSVNGPRLAVRASDEHADRLALAQHRHGEDAAVAARAASSSSRLGSAASARTSGICTVSPLDDRAAGRRAASARIGSRRIASSSVVRQVAPSLRARRHVAALAVRAKMIAAVGARTAARALEHDRVEHRLQVERR